MRSQVLRAFQLAQRGLAVNEAAFSALVVPAQRLAGVEVATSSLQAQRLVSSSAASSNSAVVAAVTETLSGSTAPQDIADGAVALALLRTATPTADPALRRALGVTLEAALEVRSSFDAPSLANLLWAINQAGLEHRRTVYELSEPAQKLLGSFTPEQVGWAAETFGKAGVDDVALFDAIAAKVTAGLAQYKPADLARVLYGLAASGVVNTPATTAITAALAGAADSLTVAETSQVAWALATLRRADKATMDAIVKPVAAKLGKAEAAADVADLVWGMATLGYGAPAVVSKAAASLKAGAAKLTAGQAISGAWGLAVLGSADKDAIGALFATAAKALAAGPEKVPLASVALLYEASAIVPSATLPAAAAKYSEYIYSLVQERRALTTPQVVKEFKGELAHATATALGAQFRPEVEARLAAFPTALTPALTADIAFTSGASKVVVEGVATAELTATAPFTPLGSVTARAKVATAAGYKVVLVPQPEFSALADAAARTKYVQAKLK